jgi:hypothetical protein
MSNLDSLFFGPGNETVSYAHPWTPLFIYIIPSMGVSRRIAKKKCGARPGA